MHAIIIKKFAGTFAENKDVARKLRVEHIMPALQKGKAIVLDFDQVTGATQSFVHALISDPIRQYGDDSLDLISFKNCSPIVKEIVTTVWSTCRRANTQLHGSTSLLIRIFLPYKTQDLAENSRPL